MTPRETPQQRYRRHKRDPLRDQILAPTYDIPPVRCGNCNHARLMRGEDGKCLTYGCGCTEYREA